MNGGLRIKRLAGWIVGIGCGMYKDPASRVHTPANGRSLRLAVNEMKSALFFAADKDRVVDRAPIETFAIITPASGRNAGIGACCNTVAAATDQVLPSYRLIYD